MSNLSGIYRIRLVFALVLLWKIVMMSVDAAADGGGKNLFCEKFANINPSPSFSFDELLHLQGFTNLRDDEVIMVADGNSYRFDFTKMSDPAQLQIKQENYYVPWLKDESENYISSAAEFEGNPDDRLDMAYYLYVYKNWIKSHYYVMAVTDKRIICIKADFALASPRWAHYAKSPKIKLLTYKTNKDYTKMHVISEVPSQTPGQKDKGLIIYDLKIYPGPFYFYNCKPYLIYDIDDLQTEPYFYLQRTTRSRNVLLVHPKTGNVTQAKLYPLAERVMPGYRYDKSFLLFDVDLGCVYIIVGFFDEDLDLDAQFAKQKDILFNRINVPFEKFFVCPGDSLEKTFAFLSPDRCETTIYSDIKNMYGRSLEKDVNVENWTGELGFDSNSTHEIDYGSSVGETKLTWFIVSMFVAVISLIAIGCFRIQKSSSNCKNNKIENKSSKNEKEPQAKSVISNGLKKKKSTMVASVSEGQSSGKDAAKSKSKSAKRNTTTTTSTTTGLSKSSK